MASSQIFLHTAYLAEQRFLFGHPECLIQIVLLKQKMYNIIYSFKNKEI